MKNSIVLKLEVSENAKTMYVNLDDLGIDKSDWIKND